MRHTRYIFIILFVAACSFALPSHLYAHKFHASFARVNYNNQEQSLEITLRLFADDLENILSRRAGRHIRIGKTTDAAPLTLAYLQDSFELRGRDGRAKKLKWIGMEPEVDTIWIYIEVKAREDIAELSVRNRILFDLFDDQLNVLHVRYNGKAADLVFKPGDMFKAIGDS